MITSKDCYVRNSCWKYLNNKDCLCSKQDEYCPKLFRLDSLYNASLLSLEQRKKVKFSTAISKVDVPIYKELKIVSDNIEKFVESGGSLYMYSSGCGNGKTAWATRMLQSYFERIWFKSDIECRGLFINVPRFLIELKENINQRSNYIAHIRDNVRDADLVIWDEIGSKAGTQFELENLLNLINSRIESKKANIYTSNLSPVELRDKIGDRLYSRIINLSVIYNFKGPDMRGRVN